MKIHNKSYSQYTEDYILEIKDKDHIWQKSKHYVFNVQYTRTILYECKNCLMLAIRCETDIYAPEIYKYFTMPGALNCEENIIKNIIE